MNNSSFIFDGPEESVIDNDGKESKVSFVEYRNAFLAEYTFFTDTITGDRFIETSPGVIRPFEDNIKNIIHLFFSEKYNRSGQSVEALTALAEMECYSNQMETSIRVAESCCNDERAVLYRLNDNEVIMVTPNNIDIVPKADCGILFRDDLSHSSNSTPESTSESLTDLLLECAPMLGDNVLLYASALVSTFIPNITTPLVNVYGDHGGFKTGLGSMYMYFSDPERAHMKIDGDSLTADKRAMTMKFVNRVVTHFDNLSKITPEQSDMFARSVTGGSERMRLLYKTDQTKNVPLDSAIILNGINSNLFRADILDRTINIKVSRIEKFRGEKFILNRIEEYRPRILYAVFEFISKYLSYDGEDINPTNNRLTDYTTLSFLLGEECGFDYEKVRDMFFNNTLINLNQVKGNSPIVSWIDDNVSDDIPWSGKMDKLLKVVRASGVTTYKSASSLGRALTPMYQTIYNSGYMVTKKNTKTNVFSIRTCKEGECYYDMGKVSE